MRIFFSRRNSPSPVNVTNTQKQIMSQHAGQAIETLKPSQSQQRSQPQQHKR